jgi:arylsulfatase A-like enzyme
MQNMRLPFLAALAVAIFATPAFAQRNVVIFVADGLRYESVTPETAPTMARLRREGVDFTNSHAAFPTATTVNASVIATGHFPGDTGNYGNTLLLDTPLSCSGGARQVFLENDCILHELKQRYPDGYVAQTTLLEAARRAGMNTVLVGKRGPAAIQFLKALDSNNDDVEGPLGIFMDDGVNHAQNLDGSPTVSPALHGKLVADVAAVTGESAPALTTGPNLVQQAYLISATTKVLIPELKRSGKPFAMLYWSRDPDATQHGATDSDGKLLPGINNTSSRTAIYNADSNLKGILDALSQWGLADNTDVIVIADHGFSTIAKSVPTPDGKSSGDELPNGFFAVDVAKWLGGDTFDPERGNVRININGGERPKGGNLIIGESADKPQAFVQGGGSTEFVYIPAGPERRAVAKRIFAKLIDAPYVGALFINDDLMNGSADADFAGALPMSAVNLIGSASIPRPAIVVSLRSFVIPGCKLGERMCAAEISDTTAHAGQGMHGSLSRADTRNFMAAIGPDFKARTKITTPVGNMDVAPTAAHLLGIELNGPGALKGRVVTEALKAGQAPKVLRHRIASPKAGNGIQTILDVQEVGGVRYIDAGGIPGRVVGLPLK